MDDAYLDSALKMSGIEFAYTSKVGSFELCRIRLQCMSGVSIFLGNMIIVGALRLHMRNAGG
eukprot:3901110-Pyramimonas_sp.AAC.1